MRVLWQARITFSLLLLCFLNYLFGCAVQKIQIKESKNLEPLKDSSFLEQSLEERIKSFHTLKGIAHVNLKVDKKRNSFNIAFVLKAPNLLRFEILTPFGQPLSFITSNGQNIYQTDLKYNRITVTSVSKSVSEKVLGIPLLPPELIEIMAGNIFINKDDQKVVQFDKDNNLYIMTISQDSDSLIKKYWIDYLRFLPLKIEVSDQNENILYEVNYSDYQYIDNYLLPQEIICDYFLKKISVKIAFKELSLNGEAPQSLFNLQNPSDFEIIYSE